MHQDYVNDYLPLIEALHTILTQDQSPQFSLMKQNHGDQVH